MKKLFLLFLLFITLCLSLLILLPQTGLQTSSKNIFFKSFTSGTPSKFTVVLDPGHGGRDPGKVGTGSTLEKNINLEIALYLKEFLENQDVKVIMTRTKDEDLSKTDTGFKLSDLNERIALIKESNADLVICIHQNSYTDPTVYGAQCFYKTNSTEGETIAAIIQKQIITSTNQTKIRTIKDNEDYYMLKYSPLPTVIAECGFLSNPE